MTSPKVKKLEKLVREASHHYYNTGKFLVVDGVKITDAKFDALQEQLKKLHPKSAALKKVGAPVGKKVKVKLSIPMPSLDKLRPGTGELDRFLKRNKLAEAIGYVISDKLDGVSIQLVYDKGVPHSAFTRGDGVYGGDITYLLPYLDIPKKISHKALLNVRGEIIMPLSAFKAFAGEFENARNMTSGVTNRRDIHPAIKHHAVVIYSMLTPRGSPSKYLPKLKSMGFNVVKFKVAKSLTETMLTAYYAERKRTSKYELDGLVIEVDKKTAAPKDNPTFSAAYKVNKVVQATVVGMKWEPSRHGLLKPVALLKPIRLSGVTVKRATAHNARFVVDNGIGKGAVIELTRSGEVIPYIVDVVKPVKALLPAKSKHGDYKWNANGVDLVLKDAKANSTVRVKQLTNFFRKLGVMYMADGIVTKLIADGLDTVGKITRATEQRFVKVEGIQLTMARKMYTEIHNALDDVDLSLLMAASGTFGASFGSRKLAAAVKAINGQIGMEASKVEQKLMATAGFQTITVKGFLKGLPKFVAWMKAHPEIKYHMPKEIKPKGSKLNKQVVVFTGFRDADAEKLIALNGGTVGSAVNSKTTYLLVKDVNSGSSKIQKAKALGVKVSTLQSFKSKFNI